MTIAHVLSVTSMACAPQYEGQVDVVIRVVWTYGGTNGVNNYYCGGETILSYVPPAPFTPYVDLTEEQVAGWVTGSWTPEQTAYMQETIAAQLALVVLPLPW